MKKICFVTTISSTINAFIMELAKELHKTGEFQITFICDYDEKFEKQLPDYFKYYPVQMRRGVNLDGIKAIRDIYRIIKKEKFDLVQYSTPNASCYTSIAAWLANVKVRLYCQWGIVYVGFTGVKRTIFKCIEKMVCSLSTHIEPDSHSNLKFSIEEKLYNNKKGHVVWNGSASGVNLNKFDFDKKEEYKKNIREKYMLTEDSFLYGFVGRITRDKGINELLEAFKVINNEDPNAYLLLVGSEDNVATLNQDLYAWSKECKNVIYCGFTNVVEQYMAAVDCYVLPSYREGFGLGVVEAEAMGTPVIVSNIPGPIDAMISDVTGLVVDKKDAKSLENAMRTMKNDETLRNKLSLECGDFAKNNFEQKKLFEQIYLDRKSLLGE